MTKKPGWIKRIFSDVEDYHKTMTSPERYRRFRRTLSLVMIAAFLIPLILTTMLSYYEYRSQMLANFRWNAESAKRTIETFLTELQTVLIYTANEHTYEELVDQDNLKKLYRRLKSHYPGSLLGKITATGNVLRQSLSAKHLSAWLRWVIERCLILSFQSTSLIQILVKTGCSGPASQHRCHDPG
jgi:hypothetical protein